MELTQLLKRYFYWLIMGLWKPRYIKPFALFEQMTQIGVLALPSVALACMFMGVVLVMQGAYQLSQVGAVDYVADLVGVSMFREIGPLITAVIVIGRSASAVTAELGTMKVSEEIDALHVMGVDPVRYLVMPRVAAMTIMLPCLTVIGECLGLIGGALISSVSLGMDPYYYGSRLLQAVTLKDLYSGLAKSLIFGFIVGILACYRGFNVDGGAEGVGRETTNSVVLCLKAMLGANCALTAFFYFF